MLGKYSCFSGFFAGDPIYLASHGLGAKDLCLESYGLGRQEQDGNLPCLWLIKESFVTSLE